MVFESAGIRAGALTLSYYGLILTAAVIVAASLAQWRARRAGQAPALVLDLLIWALVGGLIGARLLFVLNPPPSVAQFYDRQWYLTHPLDLQVGPLALWSGGLSGAGALLGGGIAAWLFLRHRRLNVWHWADLLAPAVLIGAALTSQAAVVAGDLYGPPTTLPWGIEVEHPVPPYDTPGSGSRMRFHPTPVYESLWALAGLAVLIQAERRGGLRQGDGVLLALLLWAPGLFLAGWLRLDTSAVIFGLSEMQVLSGILFGLSLAAWIFRRRAGAGKPPL